LIQWWQTASLTSLPCAIGIVDAADVLQATRAVIGFTSLTDAEKARGNVVPLVAGQPQSTFDDEFGLPDPAVNKQKGIGHRRLLNKSRHPQSSHASNLPFS